MEMKDNNYRQFKWGWQYWRLKLLIWDLLVQIQSSLVRADSNSSQVWVSHQFPTGKHPLQALSPPWYLLGFEMVVFSVLVNFGFCCHCCCLYIWAFFLLVFSFFKPEPRIPDQPSYSATATVGKLCCTCPKNQWRLQHPGLLKYIPFHPCQVAYICTTFTEAN